MTEKAPGYFGTASGGRAAPQGRVRLRANKAALAAATTEPGQLPCALVHELQVRQIELEMQNEELHRARAEAEEALEKYADLFDFAPVGYFLWDRQGQIWSSTWRGPPCWASSAARPAGSGSDNSCAGMPHPHLPISSSGCWPTMPGRPAKSRSWPAMLRSPCLSKGSPPPIGKGG